MNYSLYFCSQYSILILCKKSMLQRMKHFLKLLKVFFVYSFFVNMINVFEYKLHISCQFHVFLCKNIRKWIIHDTLIL